MDGPSGGRLAVSLGGAAAFAPFGATPVGFAVGSIVGGLLFPDPPIKNVGPRIDDRTVTTSTYGTMLPLIYGTISVHGNIFDGSSELIETAHTETTGGKGGGPEVENTTFTYSAHLAVSIGEPISAVLQVYANGQLIYDATSTNVRRPPWLKMRVYLGTETQEPDPTLEAIHGAGDVPAYLGMAYLMFEDFQLGDFYNKPPVFDIVCTKASTVANTETEIVDTLMSNIGAMVKNVDTGLIWLISNGGGPHEYLARVYNPFTRQELFRLDRIASLDSGNEAGFFSLEEEIDGVRQKQGRNRHFYAGLEALDGKHSIGIWDAQTGGFVRRLKLGGFGSSDNSPLIPAFWDTGGFWRYRDGDLYYGTLYLSSLFDEITPTKIDKPTAGGTWTWTQTSTTRESSDRDGFLGMVGRYGASDYHVAIVGTGGVKATNNAGFSDYATPGNNVVFYDHARNLFWVIGKDATVVTQTRWNAYGKDAALVETHLLEMSYDNIAAFTFDLDTASFFCHRLNAGILYQWHTGIGNLQAYTGFSVRSAWSWADVAYHHETESCWGIAQQIDKIFVMHPQRVTESAHTLDAPVSDLFERAGLQASEYDVTQLAAIPFDGMRVLNRGTARGPLTQLAMAYHFDIVDTGAKLKCVVRGNASVATLGEDDLGATQDGDSEDPPIVTKLRDPMEVPSEVFVTYIRRDSLFTRSGQYGRRQASSVENARDVELAIVLTDDKAAQIAHNLVHAAAIESERYEVATHLGNLRLEGGDVVTLVDDNGSFPARIVSAVIDWPIIRLEAAREHNVFVSQANGAAAPDFDYPVFSITTTILYLLDLPALSDADFTAGFYIAGASYTESWPGCSVFRSVDNLVFDRVQGLGALATAGYVQNEPSDSVPYKWDDVNTLTISLLVGELSGVTIDQALAGSNAFAWGVNGRWEICVMVNVVDNGDGTFAGSRILRGLLGTEHAVNSHAVGDQFIMLSATTLFRLSVNQSDIGAQRYFKAVTVGTTIDDPQNASRIFTPQAVALKPRAPVYVRFSGFGGNITINWNRQDRVQPQPFQQPAMSETSESYEVDIIDNTTSPPSIARTLTVSSETATYTAAQQTTDFGSTVTSLEVNVYQISAVVGRGYPANHSV